MGRVEPDSGFVNCDGCFGSQVYLLSSFSRQLLLTQRFVYGVCERLKACYFCLAGPISSNVTVFPDLSDSFSKSSCIREAKNNKKKKENKTPVAINHSFSIIVEWCPDTILSVLSVVLG